MVNVAQLSFLFVVILLLSNITTYLIAKRRQHFKSVKSEKEEQLQQKDSINPVFDSDNLPLDQFYPDLKKPVTVVFEEEDQITPLEDENADNKPN